MSKCLLCVFNGIRRLPLFSQHHLVNHNKFLCMKFQSFGDFNSLVVYRIHHFTNRWAAAISVK